MATLKHEVWVDAEGRPACCLAGPDGEGARRLFAEGGAKLVGTFEAGSHFEAMSQFHEYLGREPYTSDQPSDREPYPEAWLAKQQSP